MGTIIVQPDTKEKLDALKAFLKALKISFEETKSPYNPEFAAKIKLEKKILHKEKQSVFRWMKSGNKIDRQMTDNMLFAYSLKGHYE